MIRKDKLLAWGIICLLIPFSCKDKEQAAPDCTSALQVTAQSQPASCGGEDGAITSSVSGGTGPFEYSINGTDFQSDPEFSSLAAGNYTVTARDKNMCSSTAEVVINQSSTVATAFSTAASGCGGAEGGITITSTGGTGVHTYSIDGSTFQPSATFSGLASKVYTVTVKDESGCESTSEVHVPSGISYGTVIKPIIDANCAVSGCHVQGGQSPNFTVFSNVKASAALIKTKTADKSMPKVGSLTAEEIQQIACWVDDGALDN